MMMPFFFLDPLLQLLVRNDQRRRRRLAFGRKEPLVLQHASEWQRAKLVSGELLIVVGELSGD